MSDITSQLSTVSFQGHDLTVITTPTGDHLVAMKPICEAIGLSWQSQYNRIQRHPVLATTIFMTNTVAEDGKSRELVCLPLDYLNGWLFGVDASRVRPEIRERLVQYQRECFAALAAYWRQGEAVNPRAVVASPTKPAAPIRLTYNDRSFRILPEGEVLWFVAADVTSALGLRHSYRFTTNLATEHKASRQVGRQQLHVISQHGLDLALLHASPEQAATFRTWLNGALNLVSARRTPAVAERTPVACLSQEARDFTFDYLDRCRQAVRDAGGKLPVWDQAADQRVADNMATLLIRDKRWLLTFGDKGDPQRRRHLHARGAAGLDSRPLRRQGRVPAGHAPGHRRAPDRSSSLNRGHKKGPCRCGGGLFVSS